MPNFSFPHSYTLLTRSRSVRYYLSLSFPSGTSPDSHIVMKKRRTALPFKELSLHVSPPFSPLIPTRKRSLPCLILNFSPPTGTTYNKLRVKRSAPQPFPEDRGT